METKQIVMLGVLLCIAIFSSSYIVYTLLRLDHQESIDEEGGAPHGAGDDDSQHAHH